MAPAHPCVRSHIPHGEHGEETTEVKYQRIPVRLGYGLCTENQQMYTGTLTDLDDLIIDEYKGIASIPTDAYMHPSSSTPATCIQEAHV